MPQAAYCEQCESYVWIGRDGGCVHGHERSSLRAVADLPQDPITGAPLHHVENAASVDSFSDGRQAFARSVSAVLGRRLAAAAHWIELIGAHPRTDDAESQSAALKQRFPLESTRTRRLWALVCLFLAGCVVACGFVYYRLFSKAVTINLRPGTTLEEVSNFAVGDTKLRAPIRRGDELRVALAFSDRSVLNCSFTVRSEMVRTTKWEWRETRQGYRTESRVIGTDAYGNPQYEFWSEPNYSKSYEPVDMNQAVEVPRLVSTEPGIDWEWLSQLVR